jgi:hypothetical protein
LGVAGNCGEFPAHFLQGKNDMHSIILQGEGGAFCRFAGNTGHVLSGLDIYIISQYRLRAALYAPLYPLLINEISYKVKMIPRFPANRPNVCENTTFNSPQFPANAPDSPQAWATACENDFPQTDSLK